MSFYDRLLSGSDRRMDYDHTNNLKQDALKNFSFKVKAAPRQGMTLEHGNDIVKVEKDGNVSYNTKQKTVVTAGCPAHDMKGKLTASGKDTQIRLKHHVSRGSGEGHHVAWSLDTSCAPQTDTWNVAFNFKHGGHAFGPITPWTEVSFKLKHLNTLLYTVEILHCQSQGKRSSLETKLAIRQQLPRCLDTRLRHYS
jgi:hypothetical protein